MLRSRIGNDLKVMDTVKERAVRRNGPEVIVRLVEESMPEIRAKCDVF